METTATKTLTIKADPARRRFREMLDSAIRGVPVVIERYDRPEAVLVGYDRWRVLESAFVAMLKQRSQEMDEGQYLTQEQFDAELRAEGILE